MSQRPAAKAKPANQIWPGQPTFSTSIYVDEALYYKVQAVISLVKNVAGLEKELPGMPVITGYLIDLAWQHGQLDLTGLTLLPEPGKSVNAAILLPRRLYADIGNSINDAWVDNPAMKKGTVFPAMLAFGLYLLGAQQGFKATMTRH